MKTNVSVLALVIGLGNFTLALASDNGVIYSQYKLTGKSLSDADCTRESNYYKELLASYSDHLAISRNSLAITTEVRTETKRVCTGHDLAVSCGNVAVLYCDHTLNSNQVNVGFRESYPVVRGNADECEAMAQSRSRSRYVVFQNYTVKKDLVFAGGSSCHFHIMEVVKK